MREDEASTMIDQAEEIFEKEKPRLNKMIDQMRETVELGKQLKREMRGE